MKVLTDFAVSLFLGFAALATLGFSQDSAKSRDRLFPEKIAPLLRKHCLSCHNPEKARGGLDLSTRTSFLEGGDKGPVIVPGNAKTSRLYQMIAGPMPKMPRQAEPLQPDDVALIGRWIDAGAPWPESFSLLPKKETRNDTWWSLRPLTQPALPKVSDPSWCKTPIDYFVLAMLDAKGMRPSAAADRLSFLRRVKYDLHGLPPTPEEIREFEKDCADAEPQAGLPDEAVEKLIDRLLASPHFGERWGRHWLDIVHYADTHGYDKDKRRLWAWLYRDWVIRAFNRDLPFRRFLRYQLAGDVFFPGDPDGIIATGFVVAGPWDFVGHVELREGTVDKEKTRALDRDDMVANTIATFNSLTVHCARCHDHKFDPIPMRDYYQLQAVFAGVERGDRPVATGDVQAQKALLAAKQQRLTERRDQLLKQAQRIAAPEWQRRAADLIKLRNRLAALPPLPSTPPSKTNGYHSLIEKERDVTKWVQVDLGQNMPIELIRLIPARPVDFPDTPGFGFPVRFQVAVSDEPTFAKATVLADQTQEDYPNPGDNPVSIVANRKNGRYVRIVADRLWMRTNDYTFALAELQVFTKSQEDRSESWGALKNVALGAKVTALDSIEAGRWSTRHLVDDCDSRRQLPDGSLAGVRERLAVESRLAQVEQERKTLADKLMDPAIRQDLQDCSRELALIQQQLDALKDSAQVFAVRPISPRPIHILARGDVERPGALAQPGALTTIFPQLDGYFREARVAKPQAAEGIRRAALADWLCDDRNVLTWRSIVNRVWHYHFGKGIVDTPNDFGKNGGLPSHPELLDWLACDFRNNGDSFKRLHKMILMSATYRQACVQNADFAKRDADNRYLWRMNRQRLDAESIRDSVLAVSGKMNWTMYGPGYDLFRFKDDHSPVYDHLDIAKATSPETWRRTVYRFVVRSVPNPFLETLDCADPNINVPVRNTTVTALQALALLNNPFMVQQAEFFAERVRQMETEPAKQVDAAYLLAYGRTPDADERVAMTGYLERHGLANLCRLLFNANEFMFVD
jgi:mono/diheme cytochrome c family protein